MGKILSSFFSYSAHLTVMTWADGTVYRHRTFCVVHCIYRASCGHAPEDFIPMRNSLVELPYA